MNIISSRHTRAIEKAGAVLLLLSLLSGCTAPRVVFVPATNSPVRVGPAVSGRVYVWNGTIWELSANVVQIPEGLYIWDSGDSTNNLTH